LGCKYDTIILAHDGNNGVNKWQWLFDDSTIYTTQNVTRIYIDYGDKSVTLLVSNGLCTDSSSQVFALDNQLKAGLQGRQFFAPQTKPSLLTAALANNFVELVFW